LKLKTHGLLHFDIKKCNTEGQTNTTKYAVIALILINDNPKVIVVKLVAESKTSL